MGNYFTELRRPQPQESNYLSKIDGAKKALTDEEFWKLMAIQAPSNLLQAAKGNAAGLLGGPVDLAAMVMRPFGYSVEAPVMGSEWIRQQTQQPRTTAYSIGEMLPMGIDDVARAAVPLAATAGGLLAMHKLAGGADNLPALARAIPGQQGAIVYHGSPHKFDKFDMSKIGTGEGAQAYGHGLYFAESPDVAKGYAQANRGRGAASAGLIDSLPKPAQVEVYKAMQTPDGWLRNARISEIVAKHPEAKDVFDVMQANLYKVDIPDESIPRMLDWDKPLSEQPEVWKMLQEKFPYLGTQGHKTGEWALGEIGEGIGGLGPKLTQEIQKAGIPGIRYLDQVSRNAGQGTYNYVLFDDMLPRILEVNGKPTGNQPWKPADSNTLDDAISAAFKRFGLSKP